MSWYVVWLSAEVYMDEGRRVKNGKERKGSRYGVCVMRDMEVVCSIVTNVGANEEGRRKIPFPTPTYNNYQVPPASEEP